VIPLHITVEQARAALRVWETAEYAHRGRPACDEETMAHVRELAKKLDRALLFAKHVDKDRA
jgi:hypothetical protein